MDVLGLCVREAGVVYGELHEVGEVPPGEVPPYELADVVLVCGMETVDMYELERDTAAGDMAETDEA